MSIAIRGTAQGIHDDAGVSLTFNKPTGLVAGDVWYVAIMNDGSSTDVFGTPPGSPVFAQIFSAVTNSGTGNSQSLRIWRRVCDGTEGATAVFGLPGFQASGASIAYSGVDNVTPEDTVGTNGGGTGANVTANSITPTAANCQLIFVGGINENTGGAQTYTPPSISWTERVDHSSSDWASITLDDWAYTSGPTGNQTATCNHSTNDGSLGVMIALKPAAAGAATTSQNIWPARSATRGAGPAVQRFLQRRQTLLDQTVALPTAQAVMPPASGTRLVGPPALRRRLRTQTLTAATNSLTAYVLNAGAGSYALSGAAGTLLATRLLNLAAGSYTLSGATAALLHGYKINTAAGAYSVSGVAAQLLAARLAKANTGSYTVSGAPAKTLKGYLVGANAGAYTLTGFAATLSSSSHAAYVLAADPGSYTVTGAAATLAKAAAPVVIPGAGGVWQMGWAGPPPPRALVSLSVTHLRRIVMAAEAGRYEVRSDGSVLERGATPALVRRRKLRAAAELLLN